MSDLAIRVENCILSPVEGLSKRYPSTQLRAGTFDTAQGRHLRHSSGQAPATQLRAGTCDTAQGRHLRHSSGQAPATQLRTGAIGALQQRHDTTSARLSARLRDAIADFRLQISDLTRPNRKLAMPRTAGHGVENRSSEDLWALRDVTGPIFFRSTNQRPGDAETRRG
jgi:hypothetical protein